jgi:outer membrane protein assembly factor BamE (lipoprotein component of BamABCDE complex)
MIFMIFLFNFFQKFMYFINLKLQNTKLTIFSIIIVLYHFNLTYIARLINFKVAMVLFFLLTSCVARYEKHGYIFDTYQPNMFQKGVSSKRTVLHDLGSPTIYFKLNNKEHFIYFYEEIKHLLFFKPKTTDRKILLITFDSLENIKDLEFYNLNNENSDFKFSHETTKINRKNTLVDYFIENISKFGS